LIEQFLRRCPCTFPSFSLDPRSLPLSFPHGPVWRFFSQRPFPTGHGPIVRKTPFPFSSTFRERPSCRLTSASYLSLPLAGRSMPLPLSPYCEPTRDPDGPPLNELTSPRNRGFPLSDTICKNWVKSFLNLKLFQKLTATPW